MTEVTHLRRFEGKTVLLTGASSGLGVGIADRLGSEGANLALIARDVDRLSGVADRATERGASCLALPYDITDDAAVDRAVLETCETFGGIDVVVNNAGIFRMSDLAETDIADLDDQWRVNVRAPFRLVLAALPRMRCGGSVVFISSNLARVGMKGASGYTATKGAVEAMVRSLALDLAPDIRVNAVAPGIVRTPMTSHVTGEEENEHAALSRTPAGRLGTIEDIGAAVAYVASEEAGYMVGSTLTVDGGWNVY